MGVFSDCQKVLWTLLTVFKMPLLLCRIPAQKSSRCSPQTLHSKALRGIRSHARRAAAPSRSPAHIKICTLNEGSLIYRKHAHADQPAWACFITSWPAPGPAHGRLPARRRPARNWRSGRFRHTDWQQRSARTSPASTGRHPSRRSQTARSSCR